MPFRYIANNVPRLLHVTNELTGSIGMVTSLYIAVPALERIVLWILWLNKDSVAGLVRIR